MFTSLRLERFKSFKDAELRLGPFTVLIGANASGKSNLRDAFRLLHGISRGYNLAEIIGEKYGEGGDRIWTGIRGGLPEIAYRGSSTFALGCQRNLLLPNNGSMLPFDKKRRDEIRILDYRVEIKVDRRRGIPLIARERFMDKNEGDELVGNGDDDRLVVSYLSANGEKYDVREQPRTQPFIFPFANPIGDYALRQDSPESINNRIIVNIFVNSMNRMRFFDWSLDAIRQPSLPGQDILSDNGRNLSSVLQAICRDPQAKRNLLSWIAELTPMDAVDFEFPSDPAGRVLATLVETGGHKTTLASASDGTLRFLAFLAAFLGPHRSSFYFFEELENGIHPTRLGLLLDLVENQVKQKGIQVVATTHSPQLLGHLSETALEHASLVYRLEDQPDSRLIRVVDMPQGKQLIEEFGAAKLAGEGWFESTAYYMQPDIGDGKASTRPARRKKSGVAR